MKGKVILVEYRNYAAEDILDASARICKECSGPMKFKGSGLYVCELCGYEFYTDFGKVKYYLAEHGPKNAFEISEATGVARSKIYEFIRDGRVEVLQNDSQDKHLCAICGVVLEFGTYCPDCLKRLRKNKAETKGIYNMLLHNPDNDGEMRFARRDQDE